jgi:hypothetical protein
MKLSCSVAVLKAWLFKATRMELQTAMDVRTLWSLFSHFRLACSCTAAYSGSNCNLCAQNYYSKDRMRSLAFHLSCSDYPTCTVMSTSCVPSDFLLAVLRSLRAMQWPWLVQRFGRLCLQPEFCLVELWPMRKLLLQLPKSTLPMSRWRSRRSASGPSTPPNVPSPFLEWLQGQAPRASRHCLL